MVDGKMKEIKKSVRRVYMKLFVLAAVAVFGAIAIAQAQKGINSSSEQADAAPVELSAPTPIPIKQATVAETPNDSGTALVNFEETLPPDDAAMPAYAEEPTAWDATPAHSDLPADSFPDELPAEIPVAHGPLYRPCCQGIRSIQIVEQATPGRCVQSLWVAVGE